MIHKAFKITEVALRYYNLVHPEREYTRHYAVKQWAQEKSINKTVLQLVIASIFAEQKKMLK